MHEMANKEQEKFSKIKQLKCFRYVYEMVVGGFPLTHVAMYIQHDRGEYTDIKRESLVRMLAVYRESLSDTEVLAPHLSCFIAREAREFTDRIEELRRLERMYQMLEYRLDVAHGHERMTGQINPNVDRQSREIRGVIQQMHNIKMDLGLNGTQERGTLTIPPERLAEIERKFGPEAARTYADPVSRGRILKAVNLAIEAAQLEEKGDQASIDFVENTKGEWEDS